MTKENTIEKFKFGIRDLVYIVGFVAVFWASYQISEYRLAEAEKRIESLEQFKEKVNVELINEKINKIQSDLSDIKTMFVQFLRDNSAAERGRNTR